MPTPILRTKLYVPKSRSYAVRRPRLIERLNKGLESKLTLISAPAGFGKSTLASEWISSRDHPAAWLSLDDADNDATRFLSYLVAALQSVMPDTGTQAQAELQLPQPPPLTSILTTLLNEIAAKPEAHTLILDDYHIIDAKPVDDLLLFLVEHSPPQLHIVIITREDPNLPLARLRARFQLSELRAIDLRFTSDEAAEFLNRSMGLKLSVNDIHILESRTEGWIAGLQLAALSMQGQKDVSSFIETFTGNHHFILDYLLEEILQQQSAEVQEFLLNTSILERLSGPLCSAVTNKSSGQKVLECIEQANLFIIPLDDKREWYRYHHLFADVLRARINNLQPELIPELHHRASLWFEENGYLNEAIEHAQVSNDYDRVADLIEFAWPEADRYIQSAPWLGLVKILPKEILKHRPVLMGIFTWILLDVGDLEAGETQLLQLENWLQSNSNSGKFPESPPAENKIIDLEQYRQIPATLSSARSYIAQARGNIDAAIKHTRETIALLPEGSLEQITAPGMLGLSYLTVGKLEEAAQTFSQSLEGLIKIGRTDFAIGGTFVVSDIRMQQGRLLEAANLYKQSMKLLPQLEPYPQGAAYLFMGLAKVQREWNQLDDARANLQRSEDINNTAPMQMCHYRLAIIQARVKEDEGDLDAAIELLDKAEQLYYRNVVPEFQPVGALKARVWIKMGRLQDAHAWSRQEKLSINDEPSFMSEFEHITLIRLLIAQNQQKQTGTTLQEVTVFIESLLKSAEQYSRDYSVIELLILKAIAQQLMNDTAEAITTLERALELARVEAYIRIFLEAGPIMEKLLSQVSEKKTLSNYIKTLLIAFDTDKQRDDNISTRPSPLIEALSKRELEVLTLIANGLSNQEICDRLFLALSSVKGHNQKIFAKLQVQRRTEAIVRARELGLI